MPTLFNYGAYKIFIWTNEGDPLEPIHIHVVKGVQKANSPKFWLTKDGVFVPADRYDDMRGMAKVIGLFMKRGLVKDLKKVWVNTFKLSSEDDIKYYK